VDPLQTAFISQPPQLPLDVGYVLRRGLPPPGGLVPQVQEVIVNVALQRPLCVLFDVDLLSGLDAGSYLLNFIKNPIKHALGVAFVPAARGRSLDPSAGIAVSGIPDGRLKHDQAFVFRQGSAVLAPPVIGPPGLVALFYSDYHSSGGYRFGVLFLV